MTSVFNDYHDQQIVLFHERFYPINVERPDFKLCREIFGRSDDLLEVACGNGIGAFQLGKYVNSYLATDSSPGMIEQARKNTPTEAFPNVSFDVCDMTSFSFDRNFNGIILTGNSFQELLSQDQQIDCLENIRAHLVDSGKLIIMVHFLNDLFFSKDAFVQEICDPDDPSIIYRERYFSEVDLLNSLITGKVEYTTIQSGKTISTIEANRNISSLTEREFVLLLARCGLNIERKVRFSQRSHSLVFECIRG